MSFLQRLQTLVTGTAPKRRRKTGDTPGVVTYLESSRIITSLLFVVTVAAIVLISFVGVTNSTLPVLPNQLASVRIVASSPFTYESAELTRLVRSQVRDRVPPVYRIETDHLTRFEVHLRELTAGLAVIETLPPAERDAALQTLVDTFNTSGAYRATVEDIVALLDIRPAATRQELIETGLDILRSIYSQGIHDDAILAGPRNPGSLSLYQVARPDGDISQRAVDSIGEALTFLRVSLSAENPTEDNREHSLALFRLFRNGLVANLVFDREATRLRQEAALAELRPVTVSVERGQTIIEPDTRVTLEQYEMLVAHRQHLVGRGDLSPSETLHLLGRVLLVLAMVVASLLYIRMEDSETLNSNGRLALLALVVIVNLALVRTTYALGGLPFFLENTTEAAMLPYIAPAAIAPLLLAIMINPGSATFMALLIAIFTSVIYGSRLDLLVLTFLGSMVAIYASRQTRKRSNVVRAAALGGLTVAVFVLLFGIVDRQAPITVLKQMVSGILTGLLSGVIVAGLLPVLEGVFKRTTDITLLELTDYNHRLLRRMQLEAPGTYHHSLVVAQLAENAASAIGANPLLARVCALFHDIGKTAKPEYFIENQRSGINPHDDNNPSLSALIIKSHVKDGVDLAIKNKLPRAVIDVIKQHHGTTLIRYFYQRAVNATKAATTPPIPVPVPVPGGTASPLAPVPRNPESNDPFLPGLTPVPVSESTYRYDGPVPRFKESAIIHLADGVEAASRTLRKVSPQHLSEVIERIFRDRLTDGQLDDAPITLAELATIKESFAHTLLNMLHGRIDYPTAEESVPKSA